MNGFSQAVSQNAVPWDVCGKIFVRCFVRRLDRRAPPAGAGGLSWQSSSWVRFCTRGDVCDGTDAGSRHRLSFVPNGRVRRRSGGRAQASVGGRRVGGGRAASQSVVGQVNGSWGMWPEHVANSRLPRGRPAEQGPSKLSSSDITINSGNSCPVASASPSLTTLRTAITYVRKHQFDAGRRLNKWKLHQVGQNCPRSPCESMMTYSNINGIGFPRIIRRRKIRAEEANAIRYN